MNDLTPIAVYDAHDDLWTRWDDFQTLLHWLDDNGINPKATYRVEVFLLDAPFARVHAFQLVGEDQTRVYDPNTGEAVRLPPHDVLLNSLPPVQPYPPRNHPGDAAA